MAIVTGDLYKGFTFGDISSKAYGVYITQEAAYDAPERDTEVVEIAGRNGAYILDKGRYKNITVSYKCGIALGDEQSFENAIRVFRNALASEAGKYVRLEDEYNPNEYRQAAFLGGIDVDMADRRAGEFTVSFDAKPQRFLKSGETAVNIGGDVTNTQTESGSIVSIESDGGDKVTSLVAQITPVQAGSGDPSPDNVRPITGWTTVNVIVSPTTTASDGTTTTTALGRTVYGGTVDVVTGALTVTHKFLHLTSVAQVSTPSGAHVYWRFVINEKGINGATAETIICNMAKGAYGEAYNTCYITSAGGLFLIFPEDQTLNTKALVDAWLVSHTLQICYKLATPQIYNLTAQQVELLTGNNNVWADTGDITITWGDDPNKLVNPTLYDSHPLLSFTASGSGTITINNDTIEVTNQPIGDIILANVTKLASGESVTWSDTGRYLTGDAIRIDSIPAITTTVILDSYSYANYTQYSGDDMDYLSTTATARGTMTQHSIPNPPQFVAGTSRSVSYTGTVINKVKNKSSGTIVDCTINLTVTIAYDGAHSITATTNVTTSLGTASTTVTIDTVTVNSTKSSLTGTAYIDLDIGEAYSIDGGAVVSINDSVSLGASLPVLKPSTNTISKTGAVANLTIIPRWWEL